MQPDDHRISLLRSRWGALALLAVLAACNRSAYPPPPESRTVAVEDTLSGERVSDPYRWLEDQNSDEVRRWIDAQNAYADSIVDHSPERQTLATRLGALMSVPNVGALRKAGAWEYFTLRRAEDDVAAIYRRQPPKTPGPVDPAGEYEKVLDPIALRADGTTSVDIQGLSQDGKFLLYSVRDGGPDEISIRVRDLARDTDLPDSLPWALYGSVNFDPTGKGFYYVHRSRDVGPRLKYHRLGADVAKDSVVFGDGYASTSFLNVSFADKGRLRIYTIGHGWARNDVLVQDVRRGGAITTVTKDVPAHFSAQYIDDKLWMRTDLDAPKGRIVNVDLRSPTPDRWTTVIPEGEDVIDGFSEIDGKLYVTYIHNASHRIRVFAMDGKPDGEVAVPDLSAVSIRANGKGKALLSVTSFNQPSVTYQLDLASGARTVWEKYDVPFDTTGIEMRQVWYTTTDGLKSPMILMYKRGLRLDGSAPALLTGYGGFALSLLPRFDPRGAVWVEQGGVFAQATLRGGNEFGETWHKGGMLANKPHVFEDFISAAQWLVDSGYTKPERFAIRGGSNGGLLMGAVINKRPDLFRVAYIGNPDLDILRFPWFKTHNNAPALLEYGDASKPEEFAVIRTFSPYQNVKPRTKYPAMFISTGHNDTRVPPWAARKFAARVQAASTSGLPIVLYHDMRQGHAGGRGNRANVEVAAKEMDFLLRMTGAQAK